MIEHVFESLTTGLDPGQERSGFDPAWTEREPLPGEVGYAAYLAYEAQQIAFWNSYAAGDAPPAGALGGELLPYLNGARTDAGLLAEVGRAARAVDAAEGRKLRAIADYALRAIANPVVGYDERMMVHSVEAEIGLQLRVPPSTASQWVNLALTLARRLPETLARLQRGELSRAAAEMIADDPSTSMSRSAPASRPPSSATRLSAHPGRCEPRSAARWASSTPRPSANAPSAPGTSGASTSRTTTTVWPPCASTPPLASPTPSTTL